MLILVCNRIAIYKAVYPTVGTLTDVVSAIDQVSTHILDFYLSVPDRLSQSTRHLSNVETY